MKLMQARQQIVAYGVKMIQAGLTTGSGGNLSILDPEEDLIAIGPSGIDYVDVGIEDVVIVNRNGEVVEGRWKPSSELSFHLALYRQRPEIRAVVHTHSVYATTIACLNWEIPAVHYLVAFSGNKVPLAPYATFGSKELAVNVAEHIGTYNALLLANHGLVAIGADMQHAFNVAEEIELVARIYYQAKSIGQPVLVDAEEMQRVGAKFATYGQQDEG
ncbi:MAG: L-fuculose-phosphate aldolase [Desulfuromonas sp.]|nr:L-fuculose-phosphate aldolase [Desulfuromonas sp.]